MVIFNDMELNQNTCIQYNILIVIVLNVAHLFPKQYYTFNNISNLYNII